MRENNGTASGRGAAGQLGRALLTAGLLGLASLGQALTLTVNSTDDTTGGDCQGGGVCTLRQAVTEANAIPESSEAMVTIAIPPDTYTLGATLVIQRPMELVGGGGDPEADPQATILQAGLDPDEPANGQLFRINPDYNNSFDTRFAALWLRYGYNTSNGYGGALDWDGSEDATGNGDGTLTLYNTWFSDNVVDDAAGTGGAVSAFYGASVHVERTTFRNNRVVYNGVPAGDSGALSVSLVDTVTFDQVYIYRNQAASAGGAGLYLIGTLVDISGSTLAENQAASGPGGGLVIADLDGAASLSNSTFYGNRAGTNGGGLNLAPGAVASDIRLVHVTAARNTADSDTDGNGLGGGLHVANNNAPVTLFNTLVAQNRLGNGDPGDVGGNLDGASAHNLIGTGGSGGLADGVQGNQVGVTEPGLDTLADNNGFTRTIALSNGSPALDAADGALPGANLAADQRGWDRAFAAASATPQALPDIGAYEAHPTLSLIGDEEVLGLLSGAPTVEVDFLVGDADRTPAIDLTASAADGDLLPAANLEISGSGNTRTLSLTPADGQYGTTTVTLTATGYEDNNGSQESHQSQESFQFTVLPPPDLTLTKTHSGNFHQGQTGASYVLTVGNDGPGDTLGTTVTLSDTLPDGLTATALSGTGWSCDLATVSCSRYDVLAVDGAYPPVTLTVDVASDAATSLTNRASVSGGGDATGASVEDVTKVLLATGTTLGTGGATTYGDDINLVATLDPEAATGDVTFERSNGAGWDTLGTATLNDGIAVLTLGGYDAGAYVFRARYAGDQDHYQSTSGDAGHTVLKADQTLTFTPPASVTYGDPSFALNGSSDAGLAVTYASSDSDVISVSGATATIGNAGTATLTASQAGNANYNAATPVSRTVTVAPQPVTLTVTDTDRTYDGDPKAVTVTTSPAGIPVTVTYDGSTTAPTDAGSYAVRAETDDDNYSGSTDVTLTIAKAEQTLTFPAPATRTFGDAPFALGATASSGLSPSYTSSDTGVVTVSGDTATVVGAGTTTLTARQAGNGNYQAATEVTRTLTVDKAPQTITFPAPAARAFGDPDFNLGASVDSGLTLSYASASPAVATVDSAGNVSLVGAGSTELTVSQDGDDDHLAASVTHTLTVDKQSQSLTFDAIADQDYPGSPIQLNLSASSDRGLPVTFRVDDGPASIAGDTLTLSGTGTVTVVAVQAGTDDVAQASVSRSFQSEAADDAAWTVGTCADGDQADSLRTILDGAVDGNTIRFQAGLDCTGANAIRIATEGTLVIDQALDIDGTGADIEILGEGVTGVLEISGTPGPVRLAGLTLRDGVAASGAALNAEGFAGELTLENLSLTGNRATDRGGALMIGLTGGAQARLTNLTVDGNSADGEGGALAVQADAPASVTLRHVSLNDNSAPAGAAAALTGPVDLTVKNSVLAGGTGISTAGLPASPTETPTVTLSHGVVEGGFPAGTEVVDGLPLWVARDGYYALLPGSPAIGAGDVDDCAAVDQRGQARAGRCDAGAFQSRGFTLQVAGGDDQTALVDAVFDQPLTVTVASEHGEPVAGGSVTFTGPASGAGIDGSPLSFTVDADGVAGGSVTANGVVGAYQVSANAAGADAPATFALENLPIGTSLTLAAATPATVNTAFDLTATLSAEAALPSGSVDFQIEENGGWVDLGDSALSGDTAVYTLSGGLPAGAYRFRARFPGNDTHEASGWAEATGAVYPPLAVDGDGAPLAGGDQRTLTIQGGEGSDYQVDVRAPDGTLSSLTPTCGGGVCTVTFQAPEEGAFAGTYQVTVIDQDTGWQQVVEILVPPSVALQRSSLLSLDPQRNTGEVTVTGAAAGATVTLTADATSQGEGIAVSGPTSADNDAANGNPARFTVAVPDSLAAGITVTLTAASPGLADGSADLLAEPATVHEGQVLDLLGGLLGDAEVTLLTQSGAADPLPLEDGEGERYRAEADADGRFTLYAPPLAADEAHWLEAVAPGYVAEQREAGDCLAALPCTLTLTAAEDVATPRFTPPAGAYPGGVTVTLESTTPGATLRYTLDGTTPTPTEGIEVANRTRLSLDADTTIKVIGYKAGLNVSDVATARYTITAVSVDSGGGGAGGLVWWLLAPLLLARGAGPRCGAWLVLAMLTLMPAAANAGEALLGAELGQARSTVSDGDVSERLAMRGQAGSARVSDRNRVAGRLYGGYRWDNAWEMQLGYTNLAELSVDYQDTGAVSAAAIAAATPVAGEGLEASAGYRWSLDGDWSAGARLGLLHWRAEIDVAGDERTRWGTGIVMGADLQRRFGDHWDGYLSWTRYRLAGENTDLPAVGVRYRFGAF